MKMAGGAGKQQSMLGSSVPQSCRVRGEVTLALDVTGIESELSYQNSQTTTFPLLET
jgi:hypothetical protein